MELGMKDIIVWLRSAADEYGMGRCNEAADRIEKLEAALREVLSLGDWGANMLARTVILEALEAKD
jgi:hypothetical protein